uniref:NADH-ubiquinone oxidoreductase chain 4 n=1 Tax=Hyalella sp. 2015-x TaxID=2742071 RepID=A0A7T8V776_9CRUS|nr:NADH dehydrogenase subunit 4 [Hyalella sp. 2015-x]
MLKIIICMLTCALILNWGETILFILFIMFVFLLKKPIMIDYSYMNFELDSFTWALTLLSFWVVALSMMSSVNNKNNSKKSALYLFTMVFMLISLTLTFTVSNLAMFYLLFETSLIPILIIIMGWGYQPERLQAGIYLLFYTIFGSLPLLIIILHYLKVSGAGYMFCTTSCLTGVMSSFCLFFAFLVKFPMYGVHLWLLKAHVEAPVAGSMILAGVLLKLGGFGMIRVLPLLNNNLYLMKELIISISVWGAVLVSFNCLRYMDMKLLIASSSVVHMAICVAALFIMTEWSVKGCLLMMLAHGVCSSGLFFLANVVYERTNSRSMLVNKGMLNLAPMMSMWWFLLVAANMAAPPTMNLASELTLLISLVGWSHVLVPMFVLLTFFSVIYSIYLFSLSQHGTFNKSKASLVHNTPLEFLVMVLHWSPLNLFILNVMFIL